MAGTVGQVLDRQGIEVGPHDQVAPALSSRLTDGTSIAVQYGRQVTVTVDGSPQTFWTTATTVDQALAAQRMELDSGDDLSTSRNAVHRPRRLVPAVSTEKAVTLDAAGKRRLTTKPRPSATRSWTQVSPSTPTTRSGPPRACR